MAKETREEILDTIEVCEEYLLDAAEHGGKGAFAHIFAPESIEFAKGQIAFERAKLEALDEFADLPF